MSARRKDPSRRNVHSIVADTTAIAEGDLVKTNSTNNEVIVATAGVAVLGIALEASASGATAAINVDILSPGEWIEIDVDTGTPVSGEWDVCDLNDENGVDLTANTTKDFRYAFNGSTTSVDGFLLSLETSGPRTDAIV